jgi:hypothetical protein
MKYLLILLFSFLLSCDYYDNNLNDIELNLNGTESILVNKPSYEIEDIFMNDGMLIYTQENYSETNIIKIKDLGYFKCRISNFNDYTQLKILYNKNSPDSLKNFKYNYNTRLIYNHIINILNDNDIDIYYQNMR